MDIVLISGMTRAKLLEQTIESMKSNATDWSKHTLTLVVDGADYIGIREPPHYENTFIVNVKRQGASASRNIGAGSIPKYRRQKYLMFCDDDCYFCPGWDALLEKTLQTWGGPISGHAHPFNKSEPMSVCDVKVEVPLLLSTVQIAMPWRVWDQVGYWAEPGGPGGSEDYDWCMRAAKQHFFKIHAFAVTVPMCVIHCGLTSSSGKQIVGYAEMVERNEEIIALYGLQGEVVWQ